MLQSVPYRMFAGPASGRPVHSSEVRLGIEDLSRIGSHFHHSPEELGGHSPGASDQLSRRTSAGCPVDLKPLSERRSSRESNSHDDSGDMEDIEEGSQEDASKGVPRRRRGSRRRLSFLQAEDITVAAAAPDQETPKLPKQDIERHTSGIYDLIDAIGLLDAQSMPAALPADSDGSGRGSSESHQQSETQPRSARAARLLRQTSAPPEFEPQPRLGMAGGVHKTVRAGNNHAIRRDTSRLGSWSQAQKLELVRLVRELHPCGAAGWEEIADRLGRWSRGGASAERMYRTLTDPGYQKATNKHGRRLNKRSGTPMHVMAAYALQQLPNLEGNLTQISDVIKEHPVFSKELDWSARPGTKTYPRWKDALIGCFKAGRYPHLVRSERKHNGLNVYFLDVGRMPAAVATAAAKAAQQRSDSDDISMSLPEGGSDGSSE